jgi:hypothetical protein
MRCPEFQEECEGRKIVSRPANQPGLKWVVYGRFETEPPGHWKKLSEHATFEEAQTAADAGRGPQYITNIEYCWEVGHEKGT